MLGTDLDSNVAATVLELDHDQLCARLDELVAGGIMRHHEGRGYGFRHGLLRDAAYSMLLRSDRTRLHAAAAEALDQLDPDGRQEEIARHWEGAGRYREATAAWQRAGELATDRNAFVEAGSYYEAARRTLAMLPDGPDRLGQELLLVLHATTISFRLSGGGAPETVALNAQLEQLSDQARSDTELAPGLRLMVISSMHLYYSAKPDYRRAAELNPDLEPFIARGGIAGALAVWMRGTTRVMMGDDARAEADLLHALEIYDPARKQMGQPDLAVVSAALLAVLATGRGQSERADEWLRAAFDYLALHDDPFHRGWLTMTAAKVMARRGDRALALTFADEAREVALAHGFGQIEPQARGLQAWASSREPNHDLFETLLTVLRDMATSGSRSDSSMQLLLLTQSLLAAGRHAEADDAYASLLGFCEETSEWMYRPEITALGEQLGARATAPNQTPPPDPTPDGAAVVDEEGAATGGGRGGEGGASPGRPGRTTTGPQVSTRRLAAAWAIVGWRGRSMPSAWPRVLVVTSSSTSTGSHSEWISSSSITRPHRSMAKLENCASMKPSGDPSTMVTGVLVEW